MSHDWVPFQFLTGENEDSLKANERNPREMLAMRGMER